MKRFKDLNENDVIYIMDDFNNLCICKIVRIYRNYGHPSNVHTRFVYDYADKYTSKRTERYFDINLNLCGDDVQLTITDAVIAYTIYLNREDVIDEIDYQIDRLNNHKKTLEELF